MWDGRTLSRGTVPLKRVECDHISCVFEHFILQKIESFVFFGLFISCIKSVSVLFGASLLPWMSTLFLLGLHVQLFFKSVCQATARRYSIPFRPTNKDHENFPVYADFWEKSYSSPVGPLTIICMKSLFLFCWAPWNPNLFSFGILIGNILPPLSDIDWRLVKRIYFRKRSHKRLSLFWSKILPLRNELSVHLSRLSLSFY